MAANALATLKLTRPTDFDILEALSDGKRNVARNLRHEIDASRASINNSLPYLADYGLVKKIGPDENSGLYTITEKGLVAAQYRDEYDPRATAAFDEMIERELSDSEV
jgi:predicted transcriptional regulator